MADKEKKEIVQKIISAVEQPDNPERIKATSALESRAHRHQQGKSVFGLIIYSIVIVLLTIMLLNSWQNNGNLQSRWTGLVFGFLLGFIVCLVSEKRKNHDREVLSPTAMLIGGILIIAMSLLISQFKQIIPPSVIATMAIAWFSFLVIISGYTLFIFFRKIKSGGKEAS